MKKITLIITIIMIVFLISCGDEDARVRQGESDALKMDSLTKVTLGNVDLQKNDSGHAEETVINDPDEEIDEITVDNSSDDVDAEGPDSGGSDADEREDEDLTGQVPDNSVQVECEDFDTRSCYDGPGMTNGVGQCHAGYQQCKNGKWSVCMNQVLPETEKCGDNLDNDCNGQLNEGCGPVCGNGAVEDGEVCDGGTIDCGDHNDFFLDGDTATCLENCMGYDTYMCQIAPPVVITKLRDIQMEFTNPKYTPFGSGKLLLFDVKLYRETVHVDAEFVRYQVGIDPYSDDHMDDAFPGLPNWKKGTPYARVELHYPVQARPLTPGVYKFTDWNTPGMQVLFLNAIPPYSNSQTEYCVKYVSYSDKVFQEVTSSSITMTDEEIPLYDPRETPGGDIVDKVEALVDYLVCDI